MSDEHRTGCTVRTRRYLPKRHVEPHVRLELDMDTMDWMRTHSIDDITNIAIMRVSEGNDPEAAIQLVNQLSEIAWKVGTDIEETNDSDQLEILAYYLGEAEKVPA